MTDGTVTVEFAPGGRSRRWTGAVALTVAAAVPVAGCSFDPASVPMPGTGVSGPSYHVHIQFSNVLSLPARAKIMANGAQVGTVTGVHVVDSAHDSSAANTGAGGFVVVDADISTAVQLPVATTAELRQNTVLGDTHVALLTPTTGYGSLLADGGTIPLAQTKPPQQLEDTMAAVAMFTNSGAIQQLQDMVQQIDASLPRDPARTAQISRTIAGDTVDLAAHEDALDALLDGLATNPDELHKVSDDLDDIFRPESVEQTAGIVRSLSGVTDIFGQLGPVGTSLAWLAPLLGAAGPAAAAFVPLVTGGTIDTSRPATLARLSELLRDKVIPWVQSGPKVNVTGVRTDAAVPVADRTDRMIATLRMIGVVR
ncbi:MlaD family protein [Nocardia stercoris]|uniref:MlaD family protein n=1 Tax=Nocardia stercoris TaxID=2483361 RepID=UPI001F32C81F|nr:MlaD family protein [Nocardia stercoris]